MSGPFTGLSRSMQPGNAATMRVTLSGSAAAAASFGLANISLLLYLLPKTLAVRISTILNPSHSRVFHAAFTCQMQHLLLI